MDQLKIKCKGVTRALAHFFNIMGGTSSGPLEESILSLLSDLNMSFSLICILQIGVMRVLSYVISCGITCSLEYAVEKFSANIFDIVLPLFDNLPFSSNIGGILSFLLLSLINDQNFSGCFSNSFSFFEI